MHSSIIAVFNDRVNSREAPPRKMANAVFLFALTVAVAVNISTSAFIRPKSQMVTIRREEQLRLSCDIEFGNENVTHVQWIQGPLTNLYVDIPICVPYEHGPCANVYEQNTTDNRGIARYEIGSTNNATLTLTINNSSLEDNTTFRCRVMRRGLGTQQSAEIYVNVAYLPLDITSPWCTSSNSSGSSEIPSTLTCSAGESQPIVSLEWTFFQNSQRMSLSNCTQLIESQVKNNLQLVTLTNPIYNVVFTCYMTSEAYPEFNRNCTIGPFITATSPATSGTEESQTLTARSSGTTPPISLGSSTLVLAIAAGAGGLVFILIVIALCLVLSQKKSKKREGAVSFNLPVATSPPQNPNIQAIDSYENQDPHSYDTVGLPQEDAGPTCPLVASAPVYAVATPASQRQSSSPMYAVIDPDIPPEKITSENYSYAGVPRMKKWSLGEGGASGGYTGLIHKGKQGLRIPADRDTAPSSDPGSIQAPLVNDGGGDNEDSDLIFVNNILYVASSDDVIFNERRSAVK